jgi:UDP-glucuronate 4-epimerase
MRTLVTGAAGFIGFFVSQRLLARGDSVIGFDNFDAYYDPALKHARADMLQRESAFTMVRADIADAGALRTVFEQHQPTHVIHLAAQAGVRHSLTHPQDYVQSNLVGTANILECCRQHRVQHLTYASTSSVYGLNRRMPFSTRKPADHPAQFYAATKRATELMAHSYSNLFGLPTTGLRFFTVYGPWGRPDMALFLFTRNILEGKAIPVFNHGHHTRDFTYVEDIAEGVVRANDRPAASDTAFNPEQPSPHRSSAPWRIYNIGGGQPVPLKRYIEVLEDCLGRKAQMELLPMQPGDLPDTKADTDDLATDLAFRPSTPIEVGIPRFVEWYRAYHGLGGWSARGA